MRGIADTPRARAIPYLAEIKRALDQSLDAAALCYIDWLWERRETLIVVHPWLVEARTGQLRS